MTRIESYVYELTIHNHNTHTHHHNTHTHSKSAQEASWCWGFDPAHTLSMNVCQEHAATVLYSDSQPPMSEPGSISAVFHLTGSTPAGFQEAFLGHRMITLMCVHIDVFI